MQPPNEAHACPVNDATLPALSDELFSFSLPTHEAACSTNDWLLFHDASVKDVTSQEWWGAQLFDDVNDVDNGGSSPESSASQGNSWSQPPAMSQRSSRKRPRERQPASRRSSKGWRQSSQAVEECGDSDYQPPASSSKMKLLWRKYGQKNLKGKAWRGIVRCYYKCCHASCNVKKLVEKPSDDLNKILTIKYESVHNHPIAEKDLEESGVFSEHYADDTYKHLKREYAVESPVDSPPDSPDSPHTGNISGNDSGCTLVSLDDAEAPWER